MSNHRRTLKRYEGLGDIRYLTCSCYHRLPLFNNDKIKDAFTDHMRQVKQRLGFHLYAWVLMPEHFHLLVRPGSSDQSVSQILRGIKAGFAKAALYRWRQLDAPILDRVTDVSGQQHFWQAGGGYDRNLLTENEVVEKIAYIHQNPVRRGFVDLPCRWIWSSAPWYDRRESYVGPKIDPLN